MRRAAICLAILSVAGVSVVAQGAKTQGEQVSATDRARAAKPQAKAAKTSPVSPAQDPTPVRGRGDVLSRATIRSTTARRTR